MRKVNVVDVTLRDGGCVINFDFGYRNMCSILEGLNASSIDCVEIGYIHASKGSEEGRTQFSNDQAANHFLLGKKKKQTTYLAMVDYGTFDVEQLAIRTENSIDGIRLAFHKKDFRNIGEIGRRVMEKGYLFFVQPMLTLRYRDAELLELIDLVNYEIPNTAAFYIVDSFGEMRNNDVIRALNLVDHNLNKGIPIGFHSHNNLQMSYANAISFLQFPTLRDLYLDASIMGMGKGAGNLISELLLEHLNLYFGAQYEILPLLNVIDTVVARFRSDTFWGYSAEYYLSAINQCTPSYAQHFHNKHMLPINEIGELLGRIEDTKKVSFDQAYADLIYQEYLSRPVDDHASVQELRRIFEGKEILVLAPGRSIEREQETILQYIAGHDVVVLTLNTVHHRIPVDYIFISNRKRYQAYREAFGQGSNIPMICTSNILVETAYLVNYTDYTCQESCIESNAGMMALNLMLRLGAGKLTLAGFDGYGFRQHAEDAPSDPMTYEEWDHLNQAIREHIQQIAQKIEVRFLTKSRYCCGQQVGET